MLHALTVIVSESQADLLLKALDEAGSCGILLEDADEGQDNESPIFGEPSEVPVDEPRYWPRNKIKAYFDAALTPDHPAMQLVKNLSYTLEAVEPQDWVSKTQAQFSPIEITPHLWIVPSWHREELSEQLPADAISIELDPGLAFGTGSHPTTRMCLQWLAAHLPKGATVLDYGCGSGILAIAAQKLGAGSVAGVDIDPQAVISATQNAAVNQCPQIMFDLPDTLAGNQKTFEVVLANILASPLKIMASLLAARTTGTLILSGILERQVDEVTAAYAPYIALKVWRADEGWVCMTARQSASA